MVVVSIFCIRCRRVAECQLLQRLQLLDNLLQLIVSGACVCAAALWAFNWVFQLTMAFLAHRMTLRALHDTTVEHDKAHRTEHRVAQYVCLKHNLVRFLCFFFVSRVNFTIDMFFHLSWLIEYENYLLTGVGDDEDISDIRFRALLLRRNMVYCSTQIFAMTHTLCFAYDAEKKNGCE